MPGKVTELVNVVGPLTVRALSTVNLCTDRLFIPANPVTPKLEAKMCPVDSMVPAVTREASILPASSVSTTAGPLT